MDPGRALYVLARFLIGLRGSLQVLVGSRSECSDPVSHGEVNSSDKAVSPHVCTAEPFATPHGPPLESAKTG